MNYNIHIQYSHISWLGHGIHRDGLATVNLFSWWMIHEWWMTHSLIHSVKWFISFIHCSNPKSQAGKSHHGTHHSGAHAVPNLAGKARSGSGSPVKTEWSGWRKGWSGWTGWAGVKALQQGRLSRCQEPTRTSVQPCQPWHPNDAGIVDDGEHSGRRTHNWCDWSFQRILL